MSKKDTMLKVIRRFHALAVAAAKPDAKFKGEQPENVTPGEVIKLAGNKFKSDNSGVTLFGPYSGPPRRFEDDEITVQDALNLERGVAFVFNDTSPPFEENIVFKKGVPGPTGADENISRVVGSMENNGTLALNNNELLWAFYEALFFHHVGEVVEGQGIEAILVKTPGNMQSGWALSETEAGRVLDKIKEMAKYNMFPSIGPETPRPSDILENALEVAAPQAAAVSIAPASQQDIDGYLSTEMRTEFVTEEVVNAGQYTKAIEELGSYYTAELNAILDEVDAALENLKRGEVKEASDTLTSIKVKPFVLGEDLIGASFSADGSETATGAPHRPANLEREMEALARAIANSKQGKAYDDAAIAESFGAQLGHRSDSAVTELVHAASQSPYNPQAVQEAVEEFIQAHRMSGEATSHVADFAHQAAQADPERNLLSTLKAARAAGANITV